MKKNFKLFLSLWLFWFLAVSSLTFAQSFPVLPFPSQFFPPIMSNPQSGMPTIQSPAVSYDFSAWWSYNPTPLFTTILPEVSSIWVSPVVITVRKIVQIDLTSKEHNWPCKPPYMCDFISEMSSSKKEYVWHVTLIKQ